MYAALVLFFPALVLKKGIWNYRWQTRVDPAIKVGRPAHSVAAKQTQTEEVVLRRSVEDVCRAKCAGDVKFAPVCRLSVQDGALHFHRPRVV